MSETVIEKVRQLVSDGGMTKAGLARAVGLHANTLRDCSEPDWNPTADTLGKLERFLSANDDRPVLCPIEEIIEEARNGRMFVLVDDEDRENEGDLVIPAQMATPASVNFMATHGRGLICLSLSSERCAELGLEPMSRHNGTAYETAFTVSIEAKDGVTTGISAGDRARTISVAIDGSKSKDDIVTPGHVFPLQARDGGVLVRAGHTEAAVDISRLAGLNPSGVICEIMSDDGTMARMDDLITFARMHELKIGTIRDLIAYRRKHDRMVEMQREYSFDSRWGGQWRARAYYNSATGDETMVLVKGHVDPDKPTLVRMHTLAMFADTFGELGTRASLLSRSMELIAEEGNGVIVVLNKPAVNSMSNVIDLKLDLLKGKVPKMDDMRDYGVGAQILAELGVQDMVLLTNTKYSLVALEGYGLNIVGQTPID
ncbi:MAG: 3,4-dihydroxy-2-butanone-4-phosphate synthase [Sphingomonadaceae bacterium]|nr:3,4-dihydroxy-2-butanone-4-phosphate synthase [Sphingomonadaceae bacterium]